MKKRTTTTKTNPEIEATPAKKAKRILLGIDVHARSYRVVRQIDGATPQPAQKFTPESFLIWAKKQTTMAEEVHACYEAGPFGYGLHRALEAMGITNVVIRPQNWDELNKGVKTDRTDALAMVQRLSLYVVGNERALAIVSVPTPEVELSRSLNRHRQQLVGNRGVIEAQGRSLLLYYGVQLAGKWWRPLYWKGLAKLVPGTVLAVLTAKRTIILALEAEVLALSEEIREKAAPQPVGFGGLTAELIDGEVKDWHRFKNRRQIASYTGLCPGVQASGEQSRSTSITKHGNPRLRTALVELAWRVSRGQPNYRPAQQARALLSGSPAGQRKKAIVALARKLCVDLWRLRTGRTTFEKLGLQVATQETTES